MNCEGRLVKQVETRHQDGRAIERASDAGVLAVAAAGVGCVKEGVVTDHILAHVVRPFENLRPENTKKASEDHRPKIIILWRGWSLRNNAMAPPEHREWVPMSDGAKPNVVLPLQAWQV